MTDIVSVTVYIADLNEVPEMNEVYKKSSCQIPNRPAPLFRLRV